MKRLLSAGAAAAVLAASTAASDLNLRLESGGSSVVTASPGATISYEIVGELTDNLNEGLAMFALDLELDGGALAQADDPAPSSTMDVFSRPEGIDNPAGFGGTPDGSGNLLQVGGAQNTINNTFGSYPIGGVATGLAANGLPEVLVSGNITLPEQPGTYLLRAMNVQANVIRQGETGMPFWAVERTGVGSIVQLQVEVVALFQDVASISLSAGGSINFTLDAGPNHALQGYLLGGSLSGTSPGTTLPGGLLLPLNIPDAYFDFTVLNPNVPPLRNTLGTLDGAGTSTAGFNLAPGGPAGLAGMTVSHAFVTLGPLDFVSNAKTFVFLP